MEPRQDRLVEAEGDPQVDAKTRQMIEGSLVLQELDLLGQQQASALTRRLIDAFLAPPDLRTETMIAYAQAFFADYTVPVDIRRDDPLATEFQTDDPQMQDYYCYLLLDLVTADRDLEELPLASGLAVSQQLGLKSRFIELAREELRLRKKQIDKIDAEKENLLSQYTAVGSFNAQPQAPAR